MAAVEQADTGTKRIDGLHSIAGSYDVLLCDVWGVLHNGVRPMAGALRALGEFRGKGGTVVMITNAPRQRSSVFAQLDAMGVPDGTFDTVVTSGDVTRDLIAAGPNRIFHIGPDKDLNLFEGLDIERVSEEEAQAVVCSGLWDDTTETPDDYADLLKRLKARNLDFICANPDIVVHVGDQLLYCAGAIARVYAGLGGNTLIAGKPHKPIYEMAMREAASLRGAPIDKARTLAIGDGMPTDVKGGADNGFDVLYISAGIHAGEYGLPDDPDHADVNRFIRSQGFSPVAYMPRLDW